MGVQQKLRGVAIAALLSPELQRLESGVRGAVRALARRPRRLDVYVRADDPYSYLLAQLASDLCRRYPISLRWVALPTPPAELEPEPELRLRYAVRDCRELARYYEVEFPDSGPDTLDAQQVRRASALWTALSPDAQSATETVADVARALWSGDELALARVESRRESSGVETEAILAANAAEALRRGHYQGAMMYVDGLWAWGPDRLRYIERALGGPGPRPLFRRRSSVRSGGASASADHLEIYFSFRSPYSYLALEQTFALVDRLGVELVIRPVLPMVMRGMAVPRAKRLYIARDAMREARRLEIPYGLICDPVGAGVERCMALFERAERAGRARELVLSAGRGIWAEALDPADDGDLRIIAERAGLDGADLAAADSDSWRGWAEDNRRALSDLGLWGVPSFSTGEVSCWGQDRIWMIEDKIRRAQAATS